MHALIPKVDEGNAPELWRVCSNETEHVYPVNYPIGTSVMMTLYVSFAGRYPGISPLRARAG